MYTEQNPHPYYEFMNYVRSRMHGGMATGRTYHQWVELQLKFLRERISSLTAEKARVLALPNRHFIDEAELAEALEIEKMSFRT
jgi:hypothetical protein